MITRIFKTKKALTLIRNKASESKRQLCDMNNYMNKYFLDRLDYNNPWMRLERKVLGGV